MVRAAIRAGAASLVPVTGVALLVRGASGAAAAALALALVVANFALSGAALDAAARRWPLSFPAVALPSYAFRMAGLFVAMSLVKSSPADPIVFAIVFCAAVAGLVAYECVVWARTPWLALTLSEEKL
ncbi:MAG: hypothetical protein HY775_05670 [Acidobacteria bacterium]|nr:hypothetical protein [Acidobacteriota bacterium]